MPFFKYEPVILSSENGEVTFNVEGDLGDLTVAEVAYIDVFEGWTKTVSPVVVATQKAIGDGARIAKKFYHQGRLLMVEGLVAAPTEDATELAWHLLVDRAFPVNTDIEVTHEGPIPMTGTFRVISDVRPTQWTDTGFRFAVDLMSEDSYLYAADNVLTGTSGIVGNSSGGMTFPLTFPLDFNPDSSGAGNSVVINNLGTAETLPTIFLQGPLDDGWRLENETTGEFISFDIPLLAGQEMTIDFKTRSATIDGSQVSGLIQGEWWTIVPKVNVIKLYGNYYPTASFTVTARSAWR